MKIYRSTWLVFMTMMLLSLLAACAANQPPPSPTVDAPGFWLGLIAPIAFIVSLFSDEVRIYAFPNAGRWYDFGFMLGIGGFSGGIFAGSRRRG